MVRVPLQANMGTAGGMFALQEAHLEGPEVQPVDGRRLQDFERCGSLGEWFATLQLLPPEVKRGHTVGWFARLCGRA